MTNYLVKTINLKPEAQAIVDCLRNVKFDGQHDRAAIEQALKDYLVALDLPCRPIEIHSSRAVVLNSAATWDAARDRAWKTVWLDAWDLVREAARDPARNKARDLAREVAFEVARNATWDAVRDAMQDEAWDAAREASFDATSDAQWGAAIVNSLYDHPDYEKIKAPFCAMAKALKAGLFALWITPEKVIVAV
jgi:hypothetical protein